MHSLQGGLALDRGAACVHACSQCMWFAYAVSLDAVMHPGNDFGALYITFPTVWGVLRIVS